MARKHVHTPLDQNTLPTKSHCDGQRFGYSPRTLQTLLLSLGYGKPLLFIGTQGYTVGTCISGMCGWSYTRS
jgi:hypothetical protein